MLLGVNPESFRRGRGGGRHEGSVIDRKRSRGMWEWGKKRPSARRRAHPLGKKQLARRTLEGGLRGRSQTRETGSDDANPFVTQRKKKGDLRALSSRGRKTKKNTRTNRGQRPERGDRPNLFGDPVAVGRGTGLARKKHLGFQKGRDGKGGWRQQRPTKKAHPRKTPKKKKTLLGDTTL